MFTLAYALMILVIGVSIKDADDYEYITHFLLKLVVMFRNSCNGGIEVFRYGHWDPGYDD